MEIYDAEGQILGRMASVIAKKIIREERIEVVNVEKSVLSGRKNSIVNNYKDRMNRGDPFKGPFFPRTPVGIFKRTVRGMLPMEKAKGKDAFRRLKAHVSVPEDFKNKSVSFKKIKAADAGRLKTSFITLGELSIALGAKKRW